MENKEYMQINEKTIYPKIDFHLEKRNEDILVVQTIVVLKCRKTDVIFKRWIRDEVKFDNIKLANCLNNLLNLFHDSLYKNQVFGVYAEDTHDKIIEEKEYKALLEQHG